MAKNKKKKSKQEVEKKYGTGIAPVSNKFTLNTQSNKKTTSKSSTKNKKKESTKKVDAVETIKKNTNLKEKKQILENNIKFEQDIIDNNKFYDNKEQNMSYGVNHYKEAIKSDKAELQKVNKKLNEIAPVEIKQDDRFTIKTPDVKPRTEKEEKEYQKRVKESQSEFKTGTKYVGKKATAGLSQGLTGIVDAPLQNIQEGMMKGEQDSLLKNIGKVIISGYDNFGIFNLPEIGKNAYNRFKDDDLTTWQKISQTGLELLNNGGYVDKLESVGRIAQAINPVTKIYNKLTGENVKESEMFNELRNYVNKPNENIQEWAEKDANKVSKTGKTIGGAVQTTTNMIPSIAASIITHNPNIGLAAMGISAKGSATREAEKQGMDLSTANDIGNAKALVEVATEKISSGAKIFGAGELDDIVEKGINSTIKNKFANYLAKQGAGIAGEIVEETISDIVDTAIDKGTVNPDASYSFNDWKETGLMTTLSTLLLNSVTGGYSPSTYTQNATELEKFNQSDNVQKIIEKELEERINTEYKGKATAKEIAQLQKEVIEDIQKGYISIDTIEKTLGGDTYNKLESINKERNKIQEQINELEQKAKNNELSSLEEKQKLNDLKEQIKTIDDTEIRNQLNKEIQETIKNDIGLQESYREIGRRAENYQKDLSTVTDEKQRAVYQKAMESGVLNNSNKTHALVDMIAKISSEKGINFDFTNNEQLEKSGFGVNGRNINGYVTDSGITINLNSSKAINRIVGHELTHTFEGTTLYTELQDSLKDFLGSEWDNQVAKYKDLYKGVKNANIENELTSDLIGDYLFTDENYVRSLSTEHRNLFQKIYDEIKYLYNVATAGSKEKRQLEKVKKVFDRIYNETKSKVTSEDIKLSLMYSKDTGNVAVYDGVNFIVDPSKNESWNVKKYFNDNFKGKEVNGVIFDQARKYAYPGKKQANVKTVKNPSVTILDDILNSNYKMVHEPAKIINENGSIKNHSGLDMSGGINRYSVKIGIPNNNKVNIYDADFLTRIDKNGKEYFYDIDKIKEAAVRTVDKSKLSAASVDNNISQSNENVKSLEQQAEDVATKIMEDAILEENGMIDNFKSYIEEEGITNPTQKDIEDSLVDLLGYDNDLTNAEKNKLEKKYYDVINKYLEEVDNTSFSLSEKSQRAVDELGTTNDLREAGYLLSNGQYLDFSGKKQGGPSGTRTMDHREISQIYTDEEYDAAEKKNPNLGSATAIMQDFEDDGNIRLMPEQGVDITIEPTAEQYDKLYDYIDFVKERNGEVFVDLETETKNRENLQYNSKISTRKIINDIKEHFNKNNDNIKYSLSQDSQGRELSNEIIEKTQYSKIRDEEGKLEPFYHGSNKNIDVFDSTRKPFYNNQNVNFFTSSENIGKTYGSNVQEVYINSINPYIFDGDTDGYSLEYSNTAKEEYRNNKEIIDSIRNKLDENGGRYYKKSVAKNCDAILENKGNILSDEEINFLIEHPYTLASLSIKGKNGFVAYGNSVMTNDVVNAVLSINNKTNSKYDSVLFKSIKDSGQYYDENTLKEKSDVIATFDANQIVRDNDDIKYSLDIAPISKNFLTEAEQNELDGLRDLENSGWTELTPQEQKRMQELENKADVVLDKKAEKMLRSASYKAINTSTKVAENYLDFDAKQKKDFRNQMREFSNMTKDELVNADTYNKVKDIVSQYANREYTYFDDTVEGIKRELKHTKIKVTDDMKNQITDYGYFVRDSKLMLRRNSGTPVDQVYQEYSEMYPNFFDADVWNEADELERLNEFMNHDFSVTEKYRLTDEDLKNATDIIYNKLLDNSLSQQDLVTTEEVLDKKVQKRTRTVVREELLDKMGITPELISEGNDISAISFARTDPIRVNEKVFGWKTGQLINDATVNFTKHQEAERMRFLNKERQEIKDLGIKARSKESELVQKYGEKQYVDKNNEVHPYTDAELNRDVKDVATREKIKNAARVLRQKYDTYIDKVNSVLTEMGYDEIPKRQDYMRHFVELDDKFSRWGLPFNPESMSAEDLPTDINGLTEFNRPGKSYFASANTRTGLQTTYDAITGIDGYLEGVSNLIYHTESIQRYRALTRFIRENYGREHGLDNIDLMTDEELAERIKDIQDNKLSKYVSWLDEQANSIAGKKGALDRSVERMFGRRVYTALNTLKSQVGSNMTGFNVRSAMTNFASAIQGMSKTQKLAFVKGTVSTINNIIHDDGMINKSDFLTRRLLDTQSLALKPWQKISQAGQIFMNGTDYFTANQIWRSKYYENLSKGMSEQQAITNADDFAARIMGDRSKGSTAELFNSKTLGFLSQFQLEVNNQWSSLIHDNKIDIQKGNKTALGVTFELGQLFAASYLFNTLMKELTGSDVMIDPIDMLLKIFKSDDDDKDEGIVKRAQKVLGELINNLPFANLITGGGRIPISEAFTGVKTLGNKLIGGTDNYGNEITWGDVKDDTLESLAYWVLPTGYGQLRKTVKGLSMYDDKLPIAGSYTDSGNLRFSAEDTAYGKVKAGLFGQYSSKYAQDYIDSGYKSIKSTNLDEMKDLDMNSTEYRDYREGLTAAGKKRDDKLQYINSLDVSEEDKDIMGSNVVKKDIDMSEYGKYGTYKEFDYAQKHPYKHKIMDMVGGYDKYKEIQQEINDITADYDRKGNAITNSRKNKVIKYVNSLNLTRAQKAMLIKEQYPSFTQYDSQIASYVNNQNMSFIEKAGVLKQLGFKAYDKQIINYIKQNYRTVEEQQEELKKLGFKVYYYNGKAYVR
nr:hypothetical protein [bacterium]